MLLTLHVYMKHESMRPICHIHILLPIDNYRYVIQRVRAISNSKMCTIQHSLSIVVVRDVITLRFDEIKVTMQPTNQYFYCIVLTIYKYILYVIETVRIVFVFDRPAFDTKWIYSLSSLINLTWFKHSPHPKCIHFTTYSYTSHLFAHKFISIYLNWFEYYVAL